MIKDIIRRIEQRRHRLHQTLTNRSDTLDLSRQHQIYGAISELDTVLRVMRYQQSQWRDAKGVDGLSHVHNQVVDRRFDAHIQDLRDAAWTMGDSQRDQSDQSQNDDIDDTDEYTQG